MTYIVSLADPKYNLISSVLKKYNMVAYKYLAFTVIPQLRKGTFIGNLIGKDKYFLELPFDNKFVNIYGVVGVYYTVIGNTIDFEPSNRDLFFGLYRRICPIIDGVPMIDKKAEFRMNMLSRGICTK